MSTLGPHVTSGGTYSPLDELMSQALQRYGDFSARRVTPEVIIMMIGFANEIIELVNNHPYWTGSQLTYYEHQSDKRSIPDIIVVRGLLAAFAEQQVSNKYPNAWQKYLQWLNTILYNRKYGGPTTHTLMVVENTDPRLDRDGTLRGSLTQTTTTTTTT